jgi:hypothetical protein
LPRARGDIRRDKGDKDVVDTGLGEVGVSERAAKPTTLRVVEKVWPNSGQAYAVLPSNLTNL